MAVIQPEGNIGQTRFRHGSRIVRSVGRPHSSTLPPVRSHSHASCGLGVSLRITAEEEAAIFGPDEDLSAKTLQKIILDGRFTPDGDSYIPEPAAEQFNEDYGTKHPVRDIGFEM